MRCVVPCEKCRIYKHLSHVVKCNFVTSICNSIFGLCIVHFVCTIDQPRCMLVDFVDEKVWAKKKYTRTQASIEPQQQMQQKIKQKCGTHAIECPHNAYLQAMSANACTQPNHNLLAIKNCIRNVMLEHEKYNEANM